MDEKNTQATEATPVDQPTGPLTGAAETAEVTETAGAAELVG